MPNKPDSPIRFGWFVPTSGDTTAFGDSEAVILSLLPPS